MKAILGVKRPPLMRCDVRCNTKATFNDNTDGDKTLIDRFNV